MKQTRKAWNWLTIIICCVVSAVFIGSYLHIMLSRVRVYGCDEYKFPGGDSLILDPTGNCFSPQRAIQHGNSSTWSSVDIPFRIEGIELTPHYIILKLKAGDGVLFINRQYGYKYRAKDDNASQVFMEKHKIKSPLEFIPEVCD